jgi:serine/threonine protein kinase
MPLPVEVRLRRALKKTYDTTGFIGSGALGNVYLATHRQLGNKVAIKVLSDELATDSTVAEQFLSEAKTEANLRHPNIVRVFDVRKQGKLHYLVMDYVEGQDLTDRMRCAPGGMPEKYVVNIALQTLKALQCAHDYGIIHRNLKPSNIRIDKDGTVRVMDFGIAQARQPGITLYLSPEQIRGSPPDARSDIYSLGTILYEMVSGKNPFAAENQAAVNANHLSLVPAPLNAVRQDISACLSQAVARMLEKDPEKRWQSSTDLITVFQSMAAASQLTAILAELFHDDDVPILVPEAILEGSFRKEEVKLLRLVDGARTLSQLRDLSGCSTEQFYKNLISLHEKRAIKTKELEAPSIFSSELPKVVNPPETAGPARFTEPGRLPRHPLRTAKFLAPVIGIVLAAAAFVIWELTTSPVAPGSLSDPGGIATQFYAAPFATVTVRDPKGNVLVTQETPFVWSFESGVYSAEFDYKGEKRLNSFTIEDQPVALRENFWSTRQSKDVLDTYLRE